MFLEVPIWEARRARRVALFCLFGIVGGCSSGDGPKQLPERFEAYAEARPARALLDSAAPDTLYRFINGADAAPRPMPAAEATKELNDAFGATVLRTGKRPSNVDEIVAAVDAGSSSLTRVAYMVAEGGQIPVSAVPRDQARNERYVIAWSTSGSLEVLLSAAPVDSGFHQVIGWDSQKQAFNYYELVVEEDDSAHWSWAGDSTWALRPETQGKGCFDCHHNGVVIMKELERPWNNWNSELASIAAERMPEAVAQQALFKGLQSASNLETSIKGAVDDYYDSWIDKHVSQDGSRVTEVGSLLRHITTNTTVNLRSSLQKSAGGIRKIALPTDFFLSDSLLRNVLNLDYNFPGTISVQPQAYEDYVKKHNFQLEHCSLGANKQCSSPPVYEVPGSTFFAGLMPAPSNEDNLAIGKLLSKQVRGGGSVEFVTPKFATAILMVDFQNPVFSSARAKLQKYAEQVTGAQISDGKSNIPELFAAQVQQAGTWSPSPEGSAEEQFLYYYGLSDDAWESTVEGQVQTYLNAVAQSIQTASGVESYLDLLVSRAVEFGEAPEIRNLFEFSLLLPMTDLARTPVLRMRSDGTVGP